MEIKIREYIEEDLEWIISIHGSMYKEEYGFDETFPHYVREPLEKFHSDRDVKKECIWIAEAEGKRVGAVAIAKADEKTAQFRWFLLLKEFRGSGNGRLLAEKAVQFARDAGYEEIILWTVSILNEARGLYKSLGFSIENEIPHRIWGGDLTEEKWTMKL